MNDNLLVANIEGYAAVFGRPDLNGDIVEPGAFKNTLSRRAAPVRMLYQHAAEAPIGRWLSFREDARGLYAAGELLLSAPTAREVHALLAGGAVDGLSIGYRTVKARKAPRGGGRRIIEADLWEVSIVTFPMAAGARVTFVGDPRPQDQSNVSARAPSPAAPIGRAPAPPTGARRFADADFAHAQFVHALRGAASILSL